jgi:hypothetical protein
VIDETKRSCGNDEETIRHLLLSYSRWTDERGGLGEIVGHRSRDVPYLLEGWGAREVVRMGYTQSRPDKAPYLTYALRVTSSLNMHNSTATHALYLRPITLSSWTTYASVECEKGMNSAWIDCTRGLEVDGFVRVARPTDRLSHPALRPHFEPWAFGISPMRLATSKRAFDRESDGSSTEQSALCRGS